MAYSELTDADRRLVDSAREASRRSYAPYSRFHVGAAICLDNGEVVEGCNQENAAFPSSLCAERTAAYWAHSSFPDAVMTAIAIAARDAEGAEVVSPVSPCGNCRQALLEYETLASRPMRVLLVGRDEIVILPSVKSLLPFAFTEF